MGYMYFSDSFLTDNTNGAAVQCLTGTTPQYSGAAAVSNLSGGTNCITFWKGAMPTSAEMNTFTNSTRASDGLLRFTLTGAFTRATSSKRITANFGTASFGTILAAGTITWFNLGNTDTVTNRPMVFGTVGLPGSGADLILPKIDVVVNDLWLCTNLYFDVANSAAFA